MRIDFVSDIACPWCVIGLRSLEAALERTHDAVAAEIHFQPFELNPDAPAGGWKQAERFAEKFGWSPEQVRDAHANVSARAAETGFAMRFSDESRTYNTFDAHRLIHWAEQQGKQAALKHALFGAYFTDGRDVSDPAVLADLAETAGLDRAEAEKVLASGAYASEVRATEMLWQSRGINAVPSIIIDGRYLISGGQPVDTFEQVIRKIADTHATAVG
jgi:predicted DsbA family dithiol-disulfide isomerase